MQLEVDRYFEGKQFLADYFKSKNGEPLEENFQVLNPLYSLTQLAGRPSTCGLFSSI